MKSKELCDRHVSCLASLIPVLDLAVQAESLEELCQVGSHHPPVSGPCVPQGSALASAPSHVLLVFLRFFHFSRPGSFQEVGWPWDVTVLCPFHFEEVTSHLNSCCS